MIETIIMIGKHEHERTCTYPFSRYFLCQYVQVCLDWIKNKNILKINQIVPIWHVLQVLLLLVARQLAFSLTFVWKVKHENSEYI